MTAQPLLQFGTVVLDPAPDGRVVRFQAALAEQLFDIAERERVPQVPAHSAKNQLGLGLSPFEDRRSNCLLHHLFRLPAAAGRSCNTTWQRAGWPTGYRDDGTALPFRCRYASRREPVSRYAATASYAGSLSGVSLSQGRWVSVISACSAARKPRPTDTFGRPRVRRSRPPSSARPCGRFSSCRPA